MAVRNKYPFAKVLYYGQWRSARLVKVSPSWQMLICATNIEDWILPFLMNLNELLPCPCLTIHCNGYESNRDHQVPILTHGQRVINSPPTFITRCPIIDWRIYHRRGQTPYLPITLSAGGFWPRSTDDDRAMKIVHMNFRVVGRPASHRWGGGGRFLIETRDPFKISLYCFSPKIIK